MAKTKAALVKDLAAAKAAGDAELAASIEAELAAMDKTTDESHTEDPKEDPKYPVRKRTGSDSYQIDYIDDTKFVAKNGKPKVGKIILSEPIELGGQEKPIGVIFVSREQAIKLARSVRMKDLSAIADFIAVGRRKSFVKVDILEGEDKIENILPAMIELDSSITDIRRQSVNSRYDSRIDKEEMNLPE